MANWIFDPRDYENKEYAPIPAGEHRVRIAEVSERTFNSGNEGFEITFDVSGHSSKLWFYLVLNRADTKRTNQNIGSFFDSFGISDVNLGNYRAWVGKTGAVRVKHDDYMGAPKAKVAYCISRRNQEKLPAAKFSSMAAAAPGFGGIEINDNDLPFS